MSTLPAAREVSARSGRGSFKSASAQSGAPASSGKKMCIRDRLSRVEARANGLLVTLEPGQVYESGFEMELTDDAALIEEYKKMAN